MSMVRFPDDDYDDQYEVVPTDDLRKYEETEHYKRLRREEENLKKITDKKDAICAEIRNDAVKTLAMRMKLNSILHDNGKFTLAGVAVGEQIRKLADEHWIDPNKDYGIRS